MIAQASSGPVVLVRMSWMVNFDQIKLVEVRETSSPSGGMSNAMAL